jgi:hypothetical protein
MEEKEKPFDKFAESKYAPYIFHIISALIVIPAWVHDNFEEIINFFKVIQES